MIGVIEKFKAAIMATLGHAPDVIEPGKLHRFATSDKRSDDAGWCKLFPDLRGGVYGCHRSGTSGTWSAVDRHAMTRAQRVDLARQVQSATLERERQQREQWGENSRRIAELWAECVPVRVGDPVALYLAERLRVAPESLRLPECLRLHPALPYWHDGERVGVFPAMVAPLIAPDGRIVALHRTYLTRDGTKAAVPTVKKLTAAAGTLAGACIPLARPERGNVGIAEGIETALAARCASGMPTVAAYCAGNLAAWRWPRGVRRIVIFADADEAGAKAAHELRQRATLAGLWANVMTPTETGTDWCDVWAWRDAVQIEGTEA